MSEILALATALALEAAEYAAQRVSAIANLHFEEKQGQKNAAADLVSEVDRTIEARIRARIEAARPGDGFLGEEGGPLGSTSGLLWVVDPIDGTLNFSYGRPGFAVSIACEDESGTRVAAVVDPSTGVLYTAERGSGAFRGARRLAVRPTTHLGECLVDVGRGRGETRRRFPDVIAALDPCVRDVRRVGSAALALCALACGELDAVYGPGLEPWDMAAGVLIVEESGGTVGNLAGARPDATVLLASTPAVFEPLRAILAPVLTGAAS